MSLNALTRGLVTSLAKPHNGNSIATNMNGNNMSLVRILALLAVGSFIVRIESFAA
jgi:hypothetical protein